MACDPHAMVIRLQQGGRDQRQLTYGCLLLAMIYFGTRSAGIGQDHSLLIAMIAVGMSAACFRLLRRKGLPHLLILNREGVRFEDTLADCDSIPWPKIAKAKYGWLSGKLYLVGHDGTRLLSRPGQRLGEPRAVRSCVRDINRMLAVYSDDERKSPC